MTPFIGVRISWLMVARNSLFARSRRRDGSRRLERTWRSAALSTPIEASWPSRWRSSTSLTRSPVIVGAARHPERADDLAPREQRHADDGAHDSAREVVRAALPGVVLLDQQRLAGVPDPAGDPLPSLHADALLVRVRSGADAALDLCSLGAFEVRVAVGCVEQRSGASHELAEQLLGVQPLHHAERGVVECLELGVLLVEHLGALGDAQLEALERLPETCGHRVERASEDADLVLRRDGCGAREIAGGDRRRRVRDREDRAGDAPGEEVGRAGEDERDDEPDQRRPQREVAGRSERLVAGDLRDQRELAAVQPAVHADHGRTGVVVVDAAPRLTRERGVDPLRRDDVLEAGRPVQPLRDQPPVLADEVRLPVLARGRSARG